MLHKFKLNIGTVIATLIAAYVAYFILLEDNWTHLSIGSIIHYSHHLAMKKHMLVLGLLPIYIGTMVFGAGIFGAYVGPTVQNLLITSRNNKHL
jgi:hypothetical protein